MSEDGEKDQEKGPKRPSRPVTAAARRERRASARPAGGTGGEDTDEGRKRPAPKGKAGPGAGERKADTAATGKGRPTPKRGGTGTKQASLFERLVRFLREVWAELRKVIWPTRKQMVTYTTVVLVFVAFMVALVFALDLAFGEVVALIFGD
ncbi:preprotein translocase subunit SecE [Amycolatopsis arida]|uniref:Protein translocase subunit SecE n=1 Tax=Amycolatopsis arida TaxID=587909 RepID=A0A1I6A4V2_9PSEU|nr:preprotein translocase subunit SecE [Amycolatopsis arida]TDX88614.1 preprotein translocase subunit SecE [Amycolatopsis arida]SFQ63698.1 preprotein translocase subunit SecE [Amycolatopsis arida]